MKNKKIKVTVLILILVIIILFILNNILKPIIFNSFDGKFYSILPIHYSNHFYQYDTSTPENAIGATDYTFIAKINKIIRTEYRESTNPYTIYDATVIGNIKGNLIKTKNIEVEQMGGLDKYGVGCTFPNGTDLLSVGEYYILLPYVPFQNGNLQVNCPTSIISLGDIKNDDTISAINFIVSAENESKVGSVRNEVIKNNKVDIQVIDKIVEYKNASFSYVIPSNKSVSNKSKYDVEYY